MNLEEYNRSGGYGMLKGKVNNTEFTAYITALPTTLGRWHPERDGDHSFISLGNSKLISREHLRINYSIDRGTFICEVIGKNGVKIGQYGEDGIQYDPDLQVRLA
jgi:hypothetical protein